LFVLLVKNISALKKKTYNIVKDAGLGFLKILRKNRQAFNETFKKKKQCYIKVYYVTNIKMLMLAV